MKKTLSFCLTLLLVFSMTCSAFASEPHEITQEELMEAIENGTATVVTEARNIESFTDEEIAKDPNLQRLFSELAAMPLSVNEYRENGQVYTATVQTGGDVVDFLLYPYAKLTVTDVGTASSSDIHTSLEMLSSVSVNGVYNDDWDNYIRLGSIEAYMGCGDNTVFTGAVTVDGNVPPSLSIGGSTLSALIGICTSKTSAGVISSIISLFSSIHYDSSYSMRYNIDDSDTRAVGVRWKDGLMLWDESHDLECYSSLSTEDSSKTKNKVTYAAARWRFDVYYGLVSGPEYTNVTLEPSGTYIVNAK